jgi:hypothetical protein
MSDSTTGTIQFLPVTPEGAWRAYLNATRDVEGDGYEQAEQEAWAELQETLARLTGDPADAA